jgi:signal transduction histidine kinase
VLSPSYLASVERFSRITSLIVAGVGAAVLLGWIFNVEVLKSVLPGLATMKANTACAFVAAGSALWLLATDSPVFRLIAYGLLAMVITVGALTLAEYVFAIDVGIDQFILADDAQSAGTLHPGRMSPATALNFCLIGIALLGVPPRFSGLSGSWAPWMALPVGLVSVVAVVGYAYDARALYAFRPYSSMAIHTALLFAILCLAIICANPRRGIICIAISDTAGGVASRRLLPTVPLALFALGWVCLTGQNAGIYGPHAGLAIMVVASIAVSILVIALTVSTLHEIDLRRERAEAELVALNAGLEARVLARTAELARSLEVKVAERRRVEASANKLAVSEEYLDFALRSHQLGAWALDLKNHTAHRSLIHDQIFGYPTLLPIWTFEMFLDHVIPEDRIAVDRSFQAAMAAQSDWTFTCRIRRADGVIRHILAAGTHRRDATGIAVEIQGLVQDITERKRVENDLRRSNEDLEQKNKELDDFVYTASHDLRAPLTGVSTVAQWILEDDGALTDESRARLALIQGRIERMKRLLNDIRDYARAGQFAEPSGAPLTAAALVADVAATSHVPAGISIRCDRSLEAVQVTQVPLEQVLHNLINNAIKHHDRGKGIVTVSVESNGPRLRFSVIDDGPGIPEEYRTVIFEMFKTLKPRDEVEGSGMGLALVKKIVERMGGNCGIEAAPGRGANFWFDWPQTGQPLWRAK